MDVFFLRIFDQKCLFDQKWLPAQLSSAQRLMVGSVKGFVKVFVMGFVKGFVKGFVSLGTGYADFEVMGFV